MSRVGLLCTALAALTAVACSRITPGPDSCPPGTRFCVRTSINGVRGRCLRLEFWCDGVFHCEDDKDETTCPECSPQHAFLCDGLCKHNSVKCDGYQNCRDGSDETGCGFIGEDQLYKCGDNSTIKQSTVCDGHQHCPDGEDEKGCTTEECQGGALWCDGECVDDSNWCDGMMVCRHGQDEPRDCPDSFLNTNISTTSSTTVTPTGLMYILSGTGLLFGVLFVLSCVGLLLRRARARRAPIPEEPEYAMVQHNAIHCRPS